MDDRGFCHLCLAFALEDNRPDQVVTGVGINAKFLKRRFLQDLGLQLPPEIIALGLAHLKL